MIFLIIKKLHLIKLPTYDEKKTASQQITYIYIYAVKTYNMIYDSKRKSLETYIQQRNRYYISTFFFKQYTHNFIKFVFLV